MFYSLIGPKGSTFKIKEFEMEVYVRDVDKIVADLKEKKSKSSASTTAREKRKDTGVKKKEVKRQKTTEKIGDVGKTETINLSCAPGTKMKKQRGERHETIANARFKMAWDRYVLTSITGHVKCKTTKRVTLTLKLFKGDAKCSNSELKLADIEPERVTPSFEFLRENHLKECVFSPRSRGKKGWSDILSETIQSFPCPSLSCFL